MHAALGDPNRLAIVEALQVTDLSPSELGKMLAVPSNLLAHHLEVLENVGSVKRLRSSGDGRRRYLTLAREAPEVSPAAQPVPCETVLFVCSQNSARSQIAAALWNRLAGGRAESAGTHPAERVHPYAVEAAARAGLDLSSAKPRTLVEAGVRPDLIITVCDQAKEELAGMHRPPVAAVTLHWSVPDPVLEGTPAAFEGILDTIRYRIQILAPRVARN